MTALWEHRRLVLSLALCLVLTLFAAMAWRIHVPAAEQGSRASSATAPAVVHPTFLFNVENFPQSPLRVGEHVIIQWFPASAARPNADTATGPVTVVCTLALFGPYASVESAAHALDSIVDPPGGPAFAAPPLVLTDWVSDPQRVEIVLPTTLRPGYYGVINRSVRALDRARAGSGSLVQLVA
jgi:hypothetical protein